MIKLQPRYKLGSMKPLMNITILDRVFDATSKTWSYSITDATDTTDVTWVEEFVLNSIIMKMYDKMKEDLLLGVDSEDCKIVASRKAINYTKVIYENELKPSQAAIFMAGYMEAVKDFKDGKL